MSRNLLRILAIIPLAAAALTIPAISETSAPDIKDDGRLPGDDIPATRPCCMLLDDDIYDRPENDLIEAALLGNAHVIENCLVTHYDCCVSCCGKTDGITASGVQATPGVTVAVDTDVIPLGSDVLVDYGDGVINYYRADDTGSAIKGNELDLCVSSHQDAINMGVRTATVYWVEAD